VKTKLVGTGTYKLKKMAPGWILGPALQVPKGVPDLLVGIN